MKHLIFRYIGLLTLMIMVFSSCKKEGTNIFNMFKGVTVEFHDNGPYSVTGYKEIKDGDSVYIDFTITSTDKDMYQARLLEVGSSTPFIKIPIDEEDRRSFSDVIKLKADKQVGKTTYRLYAVDKEGIYLGDGYKTISIDVQPDFVYYTERNLLIPDTAAKKNACYLSLTSGETFSYSDGKENADKIDLGFYRVVTQDPETDPATYTTAYYIYSLSAEPLPFAAYDISSWTKRGTVFSLPSNSKAKDTFDKLTTGVKIKDGALGVTLDQWGPIEIKGDNLIYFKTPEGKYGALYVGAILNNFKTGNYANLFIKVLN